MVDKKQKNVGEFAGVPYDWRKPTWARLKLRAWSPEAPFFNNRWYGYGYSLNLYALVHPIKWRRARSQANTK